MPKYREKHTGEEVEGFRLGLGSVPEWFEKETEYEDVRFALDGRLYVRFWNYFNKRKRLSTAFEGYYIFKNRHGNIIPSDPEDFEKEFEEVAEDKADIWKNFRKRAEEWREQQRKHHEKEMLELDNLIGLIKFLEKQTSNQTEDKEADFEYFATLFLNGIIDIEYFKKQVFEIFGK
ncbi:hypothetical protein [Bacillus swezeyi]|uniref:hypothetical protein n=1 Tax=Bacillus swezeyi TaxID=1925020 RepID=UPI0027DDBAE1|nr:hypothetical protein [Bacillus swezeyi]